MEESFVTQKTGSESQRAEYLVLMRDLIVLSVQSGEVNRARLAQLACAVAACATPEHVAIAEAQIPKFHQQLNAGQLEQIWFQATTQFQNKYPKEGFVALLSSVRSSLGEVKSTRRQAWQALYQENAAQVNLTQSTIFARGEAIETVGYRVESGNAFLLVYFIQSPALRQHEA